MKTIPLDKVKTRLNTLVDECVTEGPIVITRNGKPVALLLAPMDDDELERLVLAHSPRFRAMLERSEQSIREGKGLAHEEFWRIVEERAAKRERAKKRKARRQPA